MTDAPALTWDEEADLTAAEYVLGVLDAGERGAAEVRLKREPAFAAAVAAWEDRLSGLNPGFDEAAAPDLLPRIEARLFPVQTRARRGWIGWLAGAAVAVSVVAVSVAVYLAPTGAPDLVTEIAGEASDLRFAAVIDNDTLVLTRLSGTPPEPGKAHELWLIVGDNAPLSLGLIGEGSLVLPLADAPAGAILAITLEPEGGGPGGKPSGPVLASGVLLRG